MGAAQRQASSGLCNGRNGRDNNFVNGNGSDNVKFNNRRFWASHKTSQVIETVDVLGNKRRRKVYGQMKITEHNQILGILEKQAQRFRPELSSVHEQIGLGMRVDETGTIEEVSERADRVGDKELEAGLAEALKIWTTNDEVLKIQGHCPVKKQEGVIRMIY